MTIRPGWYASDLRRELGARSRDWARGRAYAESYGTPPVIVFAPEVFTAGRAPAQDSAAAGRNGNPRHGNFFDVSYAAIAATPAWIKRFDKIHAQARSLPRAERRWRELDSSMSSDALLMNIFCAPAATGSAALQSFLGVEDKDGPIFGWKARVPLASGRFDRTEVDMRWGNLLVEAKLTEADFQTRAASIVESYRDFDLVFDRELLPRAELSPQRRRAAAEFAEEYTQEWEEAATDDSAARAFQQAIVAQARASQPAEPAYCGYQLIRNVLAAYAADCSFCVMHDARRPDLREAWFKVMAAVRSADMRVRCKVLAWQELASMLPADLEEFLSIKYGIASTGHSASLPWQP